MREKVHRSVVYKRTVERQAFYYGYRLGASAVYTQTTVNGSFLAVSVLLTCSTI